MAERHAFWMTTSRAMLAMTLFAAACGGETLDVGTGGTGGSNRDPWLDSGVPQNSTAIAPPKRFIGDLALHDAHLYWIASGDDGFNLMRCRPNDCTNTLEVVRPGVSAYSFLGGDLYMTVREPTSTPWEPHEALLLSCPLNDCASPKKVAAMFAPVSVLVDDSGIYWSTNLDTAIYACPLAGCEVPERTVASGFRSFGHLASDGKRLFYFVQTGAQWGRYNLESSPLDGGAPPFVVASGVEYASPLRIHDGFIYWTSALRKGHVARCPLSGCVNGQPEILVSNQYNPANVALEGDSLFWLNENGGSSAGGTTPATIHSCKIASCASNATAIDRAVGAASYLLFDPPPQNLVADADAIYYVADQTLIVQVDGGTDATVAIRRLPRNP